MANDPFAIAEAPATPQASATPTTDPFAAAPSAVEAQAKPAAQQPVSDPFAAAQTTPTQTAPVEDPFANASRQPDSDKPETSGDLARKIWRTLLPDGSLAAKVLLPSGTYGASEAPPDSTWQKIKNVANMPLTGGILSPMESIPAILGDISEYELKKSGHSSAAKVAAGYTGEKQGEAGLVAGMSSPLNLGIMAATGGLGAVEDVAASTAARLGLSKQAIATAAKYGPMVARVVNAGFSIDGLRRAYNNIPEIKKAFEAEDTEKVVQLLTSTAGTVGMSTMAGLHALGSVKPVAGEGKTGAKTESLQTAPAVKIVDSDAAKLEAEQAQAQPVTKPEAQAVEKEAAKAEGTPKKAQLAVSETNIDIVDENGKVLKSYKNTPLGKELAEKDLPRWQNLQAEKAAPKVTPLPEGAEKFKASDIPDGKNTAEAYGVDSPLHDERVALRDRIKKEFLDEAQPVPEGETPTAVFLGGGTASGKSRLIRSLFDQGDNVLIETDKIRARLPEYREWSATDPNSASARVHKEASGISNDLLKDASDQRKNIVLDSTTAGGSEDVAKIQALKDKGYNVQLHFVNTPTDIAKVWEADRVKNSPHEESRGRVTPPEKIESTHKGAAQTFFNVKDAADEAYLYDNRELDKPYEKVYERIGDSPEKVYNKEKLEEYQRKANGQETRAGSDTPRGRELQEALQGQVRYLAERERSGSLRPNVPDLGESLPQAEARGSINGQAVGDQGKGTARVVPDDHVPVVSRDEILSEATQRLVNNSKVLREIVDPAKIQTADDIKTVLNQAADQIERNLDPRVGSRISFEQQKQLARDLNMPVEELLNRKSGEAFNPEHAIASRAMLQSSADHVLDLAKKAASGDDGARAQMALAIARHQEIISQVAGVAAEAGRTLGSFRISDEDLPAVKISAALSKFKPEILDAATKVVGGLDPFDLNYPAKANQVLKIAEATSQLDPATLEKAAQLFSKIDPTDPGYISKTNKLLQEIKPSTTPEKLFEIYRNFLLSSPSTVIKKAVSEGAMGILEAATKSLVGGLDKLKVATGVSATPEAYASEGLWYSKGALQALAHTKEILNGEFDLRDAPGFEDSHARAIKGTAGQVFRIPAEAISRETNVIYAMNYFGDLNAQAAKIALDEGLTGQEFAARQEYLAQKPTEEMIQAANKTALHNTFQQELGETGKKFQAALQTGMGKWLFPFFKTPVNLVKASAEYSPYGLFKGTALGDLPLQARGILGSSIAAGIAYLASQGVITGGGPINFKQRETKTASGWQPYSVKVADRYYSYHKAEPLGLTLSLVADAVHSGMKDEDPAITRSKASAALNHITRNVEDFPFLMQLSSVVDSLTHLGQGHAAERVVDNLLASVVIPAIVKNVAQGTDRTVRSPQREGTANPLTGLSQTIQERIPGLTKNVPADIDVTGQPVQRPTSSLGGANPFPVTTDKNDPVVKEMARLGFSVETAPINPMTVRGPRGKKIEVPGSAPTPAEAAELQQRETRRLYEAASLAINNPAWEQVPDVEKKVLLDRLRKLIVANRLRNLLTIRQAAQR